MNCTLVSWKRPKSKKNRHMFLLVWIMRRFSVNNCETWCNGKVVDERRSLEDLSRRWRQSLLRWSLKCLAARKIHFYSWRQSWIRSSKIQASLTPPERSEDRQIDPGWTESVCSSKAKELRSIPCLAPVQVQVHPEPYKSGGSLERGSTARTTSAQKPIFSAAHVLRWI